MKHLKYNDFSKGVISGATTITSVTTTKIRRFKFSKGQMPLPALSVFSLAHRMLLISNLLLLSCWSYSSLIIATLI